MATESEGGGRFLQLLVLLVIVGGGVGWNYHQNLEAEKREDRPYRSYSDEDLETLRDVYSGHKDLTNEHYEKTLARKNEARSMSLLGEQVREFERVQHVARQKRDARDRLADSQANLEQIEKEMQKRAKERDKLKLFLRRAFTVNR